jgi:hypothetical protein
MHPVYEPSYVISCVGNLTEKKVMCKNIKILLREIGWDGMDWINLAQEKDQWRALVNRVYWEVLE